MNLLYITAGKTSQYVLVKDLSRLVLRQNNNDNNKRYFCQYCLHGCTSEEVSRKHLGKCKLHEVQRIKLLEADNTKGGDKVKFTKPEYQLRLPFIIHVDFKSILCKQDSCEPSSSKSLPPNTRTLTTWRLHLRECSDGQYFEAPQVNIGHDVTERFFNQVLATATICRQHLANKIPMKRLT